LPPLAIAGIGRSLGLRAGCSDLAHALRLGFLATFIVECEIAPFRNACPESGLKEY